MAPSTDFFRPSILKTSVISCAAFKFIYAPLVSKKQPTLQDALYIMEPIDWKYWATARTELVANCSTSEQKSLQQCDSTDRKYLMPLQSGKLDFIRVIGQGSYGTVILSQSHENPERLFAIKLITKARLREKMKQTEGRNASKNDETQRMMMEQRVMALLDHPFVTKFYGSFETKDAYHLVMEYCAGGDFYFLLDRYENNRLPESHVVFYGACLVLALQYLHQEGVIYRDLKPENILLGKDGFLRLADFGFAKCIAGVDNKRCCSTLCGSADYVAPEIIRGEGYGYSADYWSLGCVLFELLTGFPPFYRSSDCDNQRLLFHRIQHTELSIPGYVSPNARGLLRELLNKDDTHRMNASTILEHPFFGTILWSELLNKQVKPPILPEDNLDSPLDNSSCADQYTAHSVLDTLSCTYYSCSSSDKPEFTKAQNIRSHCESTFTDFDWCEEF